LEREDFTRLKKVQAKKEEKKKIDDAEGKKRFDDRQAKASASGDGNVMSGFDAADDDDVVFK
jgi:hypothetical protein